MQTEKADLDSKLAKAKASLGAGPGGDISRADAERDTAQRAVEDAPDIERRAQGELRLARELREAAERRLREARDRRDRVERLFIEDIDVSGPNAKGVYKAKARAPAGRTSRLAIGCAGPPMQVLWTRKRERRTRRSASIPGNLPAGSYDIK